MAGGALMRCGASGRVFMVTETETRSLRKRGADLSDLTHDDVQGVVRRRIERSEARKGKKFSELGKHAQRHLKEDADLTGYPAVECCLTGRNYWITSINGGTILVRDHRNDSNNLLFDRCKVIA